MDALRSEVRAPAAARWPKAEALSEARGCVGPLVGIIDSGWTGSPGTHLAPAGSCSQPSTYWHLATPHRM